MTFNYFDGNTELHGDFRLGIAFDTKQPEDFPAARRQAIQYALRGLKPLVQFRQVFGGGRELASIGNDFAVLVLNVRQIDETGVGIKLIGQYGTDDDAQIGMGLLDRLAFIDQCEPEQRIVEYILSALQAFCPVVDAG